VGPLQELFSVHFIVDHPLTIPSSCTICGGHLMMAYQRNLFNGVDIQLEETSLWKLGTEKKKEFESQE
jgi:hypothetical protein